VTIQDDLTTKNLNLKMKDDQVVFFKGIDEEVLAQAKQSKVEWFGKELSDETIQNAYQESITDGVVGASLATVKGEFITRAFDRHCARVVRPLVPEKVFWSNLAGPPSPCERGTQGTRVCKGVPVRG
jgi:hypothetical protein